MRIFSGVRPSDVVLTVALMACAIWIGMEAVHSGLMIPMLWWRRGLLAVTIVVIAVVAVRRMARRSPPPRSAGHDPDPPIRRPLPVDADGPRSGMKEQER